LLQVFVLGFRVALKPVLWKCSSMFKQSLRLRFWALGVCCSFLFWCEVEFELVDYFSVESEVGVVCDEDVVFWEELITFLDADIIYDNILLA
jgi:hypothetical protein